MDPITLGAIIAGGGALLGGIGDASAGMAQQGANKRQAARLEDLAMLLADNNRSGLRGAASRQLSNSMPMLNANLMQRGIYDSGAGLELQNQLTSDVFAQLAQQISEDDLRRIMAQFEIYQDPSFTSADVSPFAYLMGGLGSAGQAVGQSLMGAGGMGFGGGGGSPSMGVTNPSQHGGWFAG